jgi:hypothetical protein
MYRKLNYLVSQTAGEYNNTRLRGNFCRLTIGDYHSRLPGFFKSISLKWSKDYPWEIALNQGGVGSMADIAESSHTNSPQSQLTTGREQMLLDMADDREVQKLMADQNGGDAVPITDFQGGQNPATVNVGGAAGKQDMDSDMLELPHMLDVTCQFQPVHDFIPQKSVKKSPFILPTKYSKNGMTDQQDWLKWNAISQDKRQEEIDRADQEEKDIDSDNKLALAREEEARQKEEEQRREENRKWLEADAERRGVNDPIEIEEEDDPDPWDLPPQDPDVDPNLLPPI